MIAITNWSVRTEGKKVCSVGELRRVLSAKREDERISKVGDFRET